MDENRNLVIAIGASALFLLMILIYAVMATGDEIDGSSWTLEHFVSDGAEVKVIDGTTLTIAFEEGGVAGSGGCNSFAGAYESDGASISIGNLISTQQFCDVPAGTSDQEFAFFAQLDAADNFAVDGDRLVLSNGSTELLIFQRS